MWMSAYVGNKDETARRVYLDKPVQKTAIGDQRHPEIDIPNERECVYVYVYVCMCVRMRHTEKNTLSTRSNDVIHSKNRSKQPTNQF